MKCFICFSLALFVLLCGAMPSFADAPSATMDPSADYKNLGFFWDDTTLSYIDLPLSSHFVDSLDSNYLPSLIFYQSGIKRCTVNGVLCSFLKEYPAALSSSFSGAGLSVSSDYIDFPASFNKNSSFGLRSLSLFLPPQLSGSSSQGYLNVRQIDFPDAPVFLDLHFLFFVQGGIVPSSSTSSKTYQIVLHTPDGSIFVGSGLPSLSVLPGAQPALQSSQFMLIGQDSSSAFYVTASYSNSGGSSDLITFSSISSFAASFYISSDSAFYVDKSLVPSVDTELLLEQLSEMEDSLGGKLDDINTSVSGVKDDLDQLLGAVMEEHSPLPSLPSVPSQLTASSPPLPYDVGDFQSDFTDMFNQTLAVRSVMSDFIIWLFTGNDYIGFFETCLLIVGITVLVYRILNRGGTLFKGS